MYCGGTLPLPRRDSHGASSSTLEPCKQLRIQRSLQETTVNRIVDGNYRQYYCIGIPCQNKKEITGAVGMARVT